MSGWTGLLDVLRRYGSDDQQARTVYTDRAGQPVFAIGAGPSSPSLISRRALEELMAADEPFSTNENLPPHPGYPAALRREYEAYSAAGDVARADEVAAELKRLGERPPHRRRRTAGDT